MPIRVRQGKGFNFKPDFNGMQNPRHDGYLRPMKCFNILSIFCVVGAFMVNQTAWCQVTLIDAVEVFEGSLSDPENDEIAVHWDVANLTTDTLKLIVSRQVVQGVEPFNLPYVEDEDGNPAPGAYERFCWGPLCYPYGTAMSNTSPNLVVTILPGETDSSFVSDYYPAGVAGVTALEYCFAPVTDINGGVCHTVLFCLDAENCALGTADDEVALEWGLIQPMPVRGLSTLSYQLKAGQSGQVHIYNAAGQAVWSRTVNQSQGLIYIDGNDMAEGLYFLSLEINGARPQTQRFVVQH